VRERNEVSGEGTKRWWLSERRLFFRERRSSVGKTKQSDSVKYRGGDLGIVGGVA
jgi:hypothetical protein